MNKNKALTIIYYVQNNKISKWKFHSPKRPELKIYTTPYSTMPPCQGINSKSSKVRILKTLTMKRNKPRPRTVNSIKLVAVIFNRRREEPLVININEGFVVLKIWKNKNPISLFPMVLFIYFYYSLWGCLVLDLGDKSTCSLCYRIDFVRFFFSENGDCLCYFLKMVLYTIELDVFVFVIWINR